MSRGRARTSWGKSEDEQGKGEEEQGKGKDEQWKSEDEQGRARTSRGKGKDEQGNGKDEHGTGKDEQWKGKVEEALGPKNTAFKAFSTAPPLHSPRRLPPLSPRKDNNVPPLPATFSTQPHCCRRPEVRGKVWWRC